MEPPSTGNITVLNQTEKRIRVSPLKQAVRTALSRHLDGDPEVCVLLTDDQEIQRLNHQFRGIDEPTDVLTFPSGESDPLGDIAISVPYAERQAAARGVTLSQELGYLAIHGALHLTGMDDQTESERARMVDEMNAVAVQAGFKPDAEWASILHGEEE